MIINQPFGIGDILFIEPLCRHLKAQAGNRLSDRPLVPVRDHLSHLSVYLDESMNIVNMSSVQGPPINFNMDNAMKGNSYLPLRFANQIYRGYQLHDHHDMENMMMDKYRLAGIDPALWRSIKVSFGEEKAIALYKMMLKEHNVFPGTDYVIYNEYSGIGNINIDPFPTATCNGMPIIRMKPVAGFSVIDWYYLILKARINHHVSTSTFFLMQAIANQFPEFIDKPKYIYARPNGAVDGLRGVARLVPTFEYIARP